ncbi:hypothetical protein [Oxynema aestuarii]|jgi:hypothetical protein|nr:hypothetical protein [Oxynema aestuarii]
MRSPNPIAPILQTVEIDRPQQSVEVLQRPTNVSGEDILLGFLLQYDRLSIEQN